MIEGLRQLPWLQEQHRRDPHIIDFDCNRCKEMNGKEARQAMACGHETPLVNVRPPWSPANMGASHTGEYTLCPGYTTNLPEIVEVARGRLHWSKGSLPVYCVPNELIVEGIEILEGSTNEMQEWALRPKAKGGGGS